MSYPPPQYGQGYGYPQQPRPQYPPPGYPPAGYQAPPQPQWPAAAPPQAPLPGYQQPQGPPPQQPQPQPPPPQKKGSVRGVFRMIGTGLGAIILIWVGIAFFFGDDPQKGDCLSSMDETWLASLDVVECDSAEAKYEVVEYDDNGSTTVCEGHPEGQVHQETGRRSRVYWSLCAVPM